MSRSEYNPQHAKTLLWEHAHPVINPDEPLKAAGRNARIRVYGPIAYQRNTPADIQQWTEIGVSLADALAGSPRCGAVLRYAEAYKVSVADAVMMLVNLTFSNGLDPAAEIVAQYAERYDISDEKAHLAIFGELSEATLEQIEESAKEEAEEKAKDAAKEAGSAAYQEAMEQHNDEVEHVAEDLAQEAYDEASEEEYETVYNETYQEAHDRLTAEVSE